MTHERDQWADVCMCTYSIDRSQKVWKIPWYYNANYESMSPPSPHAPAPGTQFIAHSTFLNGFMTSKCFRTIDWCSNVRLKWESVACSLQGPTCQGLGSYCCLLSRGVLKVGKTKHRTLPSSGELKGAIIVGLRRVGADAGLTVKQEWHCLFAGSLPQSLHNPFMWKSISRGLNLTNPVNFTLKKWVHW